jgi:hypothetical protein
VLSLPSSPLSLTALCFCERSEWRLDRERGFSLVPSNRRQGLSGTLSVI